MVQPDQREDRRNAPKGRAAQRIVQRTRFGRASARRFGALHLSQGTYGPGVDRDRAQKDQKAKADQRALGPEMMRHQRAQGKGDRAGKACDQGHAGDRKAGIVAQTAGQEGKAGLVKAGGLHHAQQRPDHQPPDQAGCPAQKRHAKGGEDRRIGQHLAAPAPIHPAPGKGGEGSHHQKTQGWPGGEFGGGPAGFAQQVGQDRREGVIDPGVGERLADGQRPDRGVGAVHSP